MRVQSFSSMNTYYTCAKMYQLTYVTPVIPYQETDATRWGTEVHAALEHYCRDGKPLDEKFLPFKPYGDKIIALPGDKFYEREMALTKALQPVEFGSPDAWVRGIVDVLVINGNKALVNDWKGFPLATEVPTPSGFRPISSLEVGDNVFGGDGKVCRVVGKSTVNLRTCYQVTFNDGTSIVCDDQHLWSLHDGSVVPVTKLKRCDKIRNCGPVEYPTAKLPIDPYVLGLWLADGKHSSGEICKPDLFVWDEIERRGYSVGSDIGGESRCVTRTVKGIRGLLTMLGVLRNKHIPDSYLEASVEQRLDLLRGLMDGDGNVNTVRKQAIFTTTDKRLSNQVKQLLESLGQRVNQASTKQRGFGVTVTAYPLAFKPQGINPFLLPRKAKLVTADWGLGRSWYRGVRDVVERPKEETVCIAVDSSDNTFLVGRNYLRTHNTGKVRPDSDQLKLFAGFVMQTYPEVDTVKTVYSWVAHKKTTVETYSRDELPEIWDYFNARMAKIEASYEKDRWTPKTSGLCRGWCGAQGHCEFWKPKSR